ncbi:MAG: redoxin domain-containing protein, partial [Candidatus Brocadiales bacterium]
GAKLVGISTDSIESLKIFKREKLGFDVTLLSDSKRQVISQYGLVHPKGHGGEDIARPATFIIDKGGVVRWMKVASNFMVRPAPEEVLEALERL